MSYCERANSTSAALEARPFAASRPASSWRAALAPQQSQSIILGMYTSIVRGSTESSWRGARDAMQAAIAVASRTSLSALLQRSESRGKRGPRVSICSGEIRPPPRSRNTASACSAPAVSSSSPARAPAAARATSGARHAPKAAWKAAGSSPAGACRMNSSSVRTDAFTSPPAGPPASSFPGAAAEGGGASRQPPSRAIRRVSLSPPARPAAGVRR